MSKKTKLRPCPFCPDGEVERIEQYSTVKCHKCGLYVSEQVWNSRPLEAELAGALEKIKADSYPGLAAKESTLLNRIYRKSTQALEKYKEQK